MADMCLDWNYKCIWSLESEYSFELCIETLLNSRLSLELWTAFSWLLYHLHLNKQPFE